MKFLSANNFVNTTLKLEPKAKRINVVFSVKEAVEDKFGKINAIPLLVFISKEEDKDIWDYNTIIEKYGEPILISLPKPEKNKNGYVNMQFSTEATYSEKYQTYFFRRQYGDISNRVVTKANESHNQKLAHEQTEILDL